MVDDLEQLLHVRITSQVTKSPIFVSVVYGKCSRRGRYPLWNKLREIAGEMDGKPWLIGGDFNTLRLETERNGSSNNRYREMLDFVEVIEDCQLLDPGFDSPEFSGARGDLRERLDRVLIGEGWSTAYEITRVTHLPRVSSDHGPLLIRCNVWAQPTRPPFRFQNMWCRHPMFGVEVAKAWDSDTGFRGMRNLQLKLTRLKGMLKKWNKEVFGNIHNNLRRTEQNAVRDQTAFDADPSPSNRALKNKSSAEYILQVKMEEDFWRQNATITWASEGE
ncbi:uncharacterized protein LOC121777663 [Salvia splendens]|uniref:uncharacterized protein LOC121777663 n=1 Tax=Salvia splendens TaxID=180675 RepID=UPI001C261979|nr:uncharacterized protein LOC121777663 [Salvia splendens]